MDQSYPIGYGEALNNGAGSENSGGANHGWQKVTKKHKRQDARSNKAGQTESGGSRVGGTDSKVFQALERDAEEKRALKEALLKAQALGSSPAMQSQSDSDADGEEEDHGHREANGMANNDDLKKPKAKKPKKPKVTVPEAASAIDPSDLAAFLAQVSESFAESPDVQLMRFADYFGRAFNSVTPTQFGWNKILREPLSKAAEIPLCFVPEPVIKTSSDWVATKPVAALGDFALWGLNDVFDDMQPHQGSQKGSKPAPTQVSSKTKVAVLVVLSIVFRKRPEALLQKAAVLRTSPQFQGQDKVVTLAWAFAQVAQGDLVVGMQLWVQNLLPLAYGKNGTPTSRDITLQFAESVLFVNLKKARPVLQNGASRKGERLVPPAALVSMMRLSFPSEAARTKATERFQAIYPLVKDIALYGPHQSKATKPIAQQLFPLCLEAACEDVPVLTKEACSILVWCLSENPDCFKQWEKLYLDKIKGSLSLLSYLCAEWRTVAGQLSPLENVKNTINRFRVQNAEAAKDDAKMVLMLKAADANCKVLKNRTARTRPCVKVTSALIAAGAVIAYGFYLLDPDIQMVR